MGTSTVGIKVETSETSESSSPLLAGASDSNELKLITTEQGSDLPESKLSSFVNLVNLKKAGRIAADYAEVGLEAAFWQMVADWIDNYYDVHPDDSYFNHYSPSAYLLRATCVGTIQGLTTAVYSFAVDRDFKKSLKLGSCSFAAGFVWQPLADIVPLNNKYSTLGDVAANNFIVGVGTGLTIAVVKKALSMKPDEMPIFTSSAGAMGFSDAYPVPAPEPKGVRGALGAALGTALGTGVGNLVSKLGMFCYHKINTRLHPENQQDQKSEITPAISPKNSP